MTSTSDYLLSEFGDSASCPINWPRETGHPLIDRLELEWLNAIRTTAVSSDEAVIAQEILYPHPSTTSDDELTPAIINMTLRRQEAIDLYMTGAGKLQGLDFLRPSYNGKHFKPWTRESDILNWSMSSYSLFLEDHTPSAIQKTFWMWFDDAFKPKPESFQSSEYADSFLLEGFRPVWQIFKNRHQARVAFSTMEAVGCVKGSWANHVALDVDFSSKTVHGYPISESEAYTIMPADAMISLRMQV